MGGRVKAEIFFNNNKKKFPAPPEIQHLLPLASDTVIVKELYATSLGKDVLLVFLGTFSLLLSVDNSGNVMARSHSSELLMFLLTSRKRCCILHLVWWQLADDL